MVAGEINYHDDARGVRTYIVSSRQTGRDTRPRTPVINYYVTRYRAIAQIIGRHGDRIVSRLSCLSAEIRGGIRGTGSSFASTSKPYITDTFDSLQNVLGLDGEDACQREEVASGSQNYYEVKKNIFLKFVS